MTRGRSCQSFGVGKSPNLRLSLIYQWRLSQYLGAHVSTRSFAIFDVLGLPLLIRTKVECVHQLERNCGPRRASAIGCVCGYLQGNCRASVRRVGAGSTPIAMRRPSLVTQFRRPRVVARGRTSCSRNIIHSVAASYISTVGLSGIPTVRQFVATMLRPGYPAQASETRRTSPTDIADHVVPTAAAIPAVRSDAVPIAVAHWQHR